MVELIAGVPVQDGRGPVEVDVAEEVVPLDLRRVDEVLVVTYKGVRNCS
jgi:hypothetical protein